MKTDQTWTLTGPNSRTQFIIAFASTAVAKKSAWRCGGFDLPMGDIVGIYIGDIDLRWI
jgi:hypothetical protein